LLFYGSSRSSGGFVRGFRLIDFAESAHSHLGQSLLVPSLKLRSLRFEAWNTVDLTDRSDFKGRRSAVLDFSDLYFCCYRPAVKVKDPSKGLRLLFFLLCFDITPALQRLFLRLPEMDFPSSNQSSRRPHQSTPMYRIFGCRPPSVFPPPKYTFPPSSLAPVGRPQHLIARLLFSLSASLDGLPFVCSLLRFVLGSSQQEDMCFWVRDFENLEPGELHSSPPFLLPFSAAL